MKTVKFTGLAALALSVAVGCASTPSEEQPSAEQVQADQQAAAEQAIADARSKMEEAKAMGAEWRDTEALINQAEEALKAGDTAKAIQLANQARRQAENAIAQKQSQEASQTTSYTVMRGDNLWNISAKSDVYANPYEWPLIYKANRDKIRDPDLIYPGQVFDIEHNVSAADVDAAVQHARTRGAWSLGTVEQSDLNYLSK